MSAQSVVLMGRKRTRDFDLPPRLYRRGDRFYYVTHERRWIPLGKDLARAKRLWADYECLGCAGNVSDLVDRYVSDCMGKAAASTVRQYKAFANVIRREWPDTPADLLTPPELARFRDRSAPGWGNGVLSVLRVAYAKGVEWGWCASNPAAAVKFNAMQVRDRYLTDEEFRAIRAELPRWAQIWADLSYCTALRPSDALALRWEQVGLALQTRTRKTNVRQAFALDTGLREVLEAARARPILGLYVVANDKGRPMSLRRLQSAWRAACAAAGVSEAQARDVRAKAATDAKAAGLDFQAMLGHSERRMSERYVKVKGTVNAPTLRRIADGSAK
jgi:integrase